MSENKQDLGEEEREGDTEPHCAMGETTNVLMEGILAVERKTEGGERVLVLGNWG